MSKFMMKKEMVWRQSRRFHLINVCSFVSCCIRNDVFKMIFLFFTDSTRLNVWILDGDPQQKSLLKYAVTAKNVADTLILHVVDGSRPWTIMESLNQWTAVLREHIHSLKLPPRDLNEMEERSE